MKIVITQEDVKNSGPYSDIENCPLASVLKRVLNNPNIKVGSSAVSTSKEECYSYINPPFNSSDYRKLKSGEIKEFVTEYTPL